MAIDNKDKKILNVPPLRFPEFSGEWKCTTIGNIGDIKNGPFGSVLHAEDYVENGIPIVTTEHFKTGLMPSDKFGIPQVSNEDYIRLKGYRLETNDIVFSRVGSVDINAHVGIEQNGWLFSGRVLRVRPKYDIDSLFLHYALSTEAVKRDIRNRAVGQTMPSINTPILSSTTIQLPKDLFEQKKVAHFLRLLDERIITQNKIIEDLKKLKSAIRKKMFSLLKDEYTESFEINQLLDYEQPTAYIVANDEYSTDTSLTPVLTANKGFILGYTDEKFGIYQKGECIIFDDFTMDAKYVSFPFKVKSSAIKILTAKPNVNLRFMFEYLSYWELKSEGHKRHYISEIASLVIELPSKERQSIIASLMTSLNSKLDIEAKTKIRYEEQKRYLLSQMFI